MIEWVLAANIDDIGQLERQQCLQVNAPGSYRQQQHSGSYVLPLPIYSMSSRAFCMEDRVQNAGPTARSL